MKKTIVGLGLVGLMAVSSIANAEEIPENVKVIWEVNIKGFISKLKNIRLMFDKYPAAKWDSNLGAGNQKFVPLSVGSDLLLCQNIGGNTMKCSKYLNGNTNIQSQYDFTVLLKTDREDYEVKSHLSDLMSFSYIHTAKIDYWFIWNDNGTEATRWKRFN